jgi:hypothetical protein
MRFTRARKPSKDRLAIWCRPNERTITLKRVSIQLRTFPNKLRPTGVTHFFYPVPTLLPPRKR